MRDYPLDIISRALLRIGDGPIDSLGSTEPVVAAAKSIFPIVLDEAVSVWEWTFARSRQTLDEEASSQPKHGRYLRLPADFIQLLTIDTHEYSIEGNYLWVDKETESVEIVYIRSIVDTDDSGHPAVVDEIVLPPLFEIAVSTRIAGELASQYAGNIELARILQSEYAGLIRQAIGQDAMRLPKDQQTSPLWTEVT